MTTYTYTKSPVLASQLQIEVNANATITVACDSILTDGTTVSVNMRADLTTAMQTALQNTVNAHVPLVPVQSSDSQRVTFSTSIGLLTFANTPTDVFTIQGSASKIIRVTRLAFTATQTTGAQRDVLLYKRSTANTGGTATTIGNLIPHDSTDPAATATVKAYTANPTLGTSLGIIRARKVFIAGTAANSDELIWDFGQNNTKAPVLRGTTESLCVNLNSVSSAGSSADISITWTEDTQ